MSTVSTEREQIIATLTQLVEPLGRALPEHTEVVLHDLSLLPQSIVALHGTVTGRRLGDPATDLLLERAATGRLETLVGYRTTLPDGRMLRSTTMVVRDSAGEPVAALCLNGDVSVWQQLSRIAGAFLGESPEIEPAGETFARDVDELAAGILRQAVDEQGVPVELMRKEHKLAVVRSARRRGIFLMRDAVEMVAAALHVTRFTIYNYLNEIGEEEPGPAAPASH
ncbi:PAS domain-containing protein [Cellulomonas sp. NPDC089187]|uniref:helix-turn-helix transcriptional regulator n=1 Tax=Cellulomonas sp. NPDC089187 TaxID=3154970 RepID=UPI00342F54B8